jgi:hypothetical protein
MMAEDTIAAMRTRYEEEGEEGDFEDGYRYLAFVVSDDELKSEYSKWVPERPYSV